MLAARGVANRVELAPGSFFEGVPAGADAYLPKTAPAVEIADTVSSCLASGSKRSGCSVELEGYSPPPSLTARELEIVHLVARGYTNAQIAQRLWVTKWTVKFHLANAYRKLGVSNRTQASRRAEMMNLLHEDSTADAQASAIAR